MYEHIYSEHKFSTVGINVNQTFIISTYNVVCYENRLLHMHEQTEIYTIYCTTVTIGVRIYTIFYFFLNGYYRRVFKLLKMSRIAITNNFISFIDFFFIILMLICVYYFLIDLNYRNIQSTNSTDLHGRSKTKCSVITMATFIWKIGCSFCVRLKSTISIISLSEWGGGGEAVDNLDPQMVSFFCRCLC